MDPRGFLQIADNLQRSAVEAELRTSIGRSYYALYNVLFLWLAGEGVVFTSTGEDHGRLVRYLFGARDAAAARLAQALKDTRATRTKADYLMAVTIKQSDAELTFRRASGALKGLDAMAPAQRGAIVATVKRLPPP